MFNLPQIDNNTTVWLIIDGKEYELAQFNISFVQTSDDKGEPQNQVRGGRMLLTLTEALSENIYSWAMRAAITKSGEVVFRTQSGSAPLKIKFSNAYCIGFDRSIESMGGGLTSILTISPEEIMMNEFSFDNHWGN
ncbi:MAG: type VI secretion system needle protein Hcp [Marinilabiliaceae bacterium]|nr:type VI secretion system needle protein Hcp [Marinilabiliaceae bacterium]